MRHANETRCLRSNRSRNQRTKPHQNALRLSPLAVRIRNQFASGNRSIQMAAAVAQRYGQEELFVSRATIQLQLPQGGASAPVFEWRTEVTTPTPTPTPAAVPVPAHEEKCISGRQSTVAATPKSNYYTPPRILGTEAKRKNLPQTLGNFFEAERYSSAWNRVTK
ncbi:uncharacterized protein LOC6541035 [Drosophila erecta]|uniref:Uncharacterized protein n=1 Tax=Drosophila erecta TaxID=7220 RepID=B3N8H4_DROER|nr:uncharacterized protein LOC6541035 [Drosophila erecta]EDV58397.2 uncharacterized protein Dere_GG10051 [Drosophila erecta]